MKQCDDDDKKEQFPLATYRATSERAHVLNSASIRKNIFRVSSARERNGGGKQANNRPGRRPTSQPEGQLDDREMQMSITCNCCFFLQGQDPFEILILTRILDSCLTGTIIKGLLGRCKMQVGTQPSSR